MTLTQNWWKRKGSFGKEEGRFGGGNGTGVSSVTKAVSSRGDGERGRLTEPLDDHKDVRERVGVLVWRSLVRYWREENADVIGLWLEVVKEDMKFTGVRELDAEDSKDGWRLMIGCGHLWRKKPKWSVRRFNPPTFRSAFSKYRNSPPGDNQEFCYTLLFRSLFSCCPSFIFSGVQDRRFIILKWLRGVRTL